MDDMKRFEALWDILNDGFSLQASTGGWPIHRDNLDDSWLLSDQLSAPR